MARTGCWTLLAAAAALAAGTAVATELDDFARCLTRAGVTYYTASWCPHCARQSKMFGRAMRWVRSVDCTRGCPGISSLPTWQFKDGSRFAGVASVEFLASRTRCSPDAPREEPPSDDSGWTTSGAGTGTRERYVGGARIIEVPR